MVGVPLALDVLLIWGPTFASVFFSFSNGSGIGTVTGKNLVGFKNYKFLFSGYTLFWPALEHNLIWLAWLAFIATPLGMFFAVLLDREMRGTRIYQSVFFLPVVLSLVVVAFIWELQYAPNDGFINNALGLKGSRLIDWLANPRINLLSALVATTCRPIDYIIFLDPPPFKTATP